MNTPKVIFQKMTLEENIELVKWAFFQDDKELNIKDYTLFLFKELEPLVNAKPTKAVEEKIEEIVTSYYRLNEKQMEKEVIRYQNIWAKYNDNYLKTLATFFKVPLPPKMKIINAKVGLIPVFPRMLDDFSFSLSIGIEDWKIIETTAHEVLHFIWFEKWKLLYPKTPRRYFDSPYLEWKYSEMVTDPILNNKPFKEMFTFQERGYDSFYQLYDENELVMDKLRKIYSTGDSIENKIKDGFTYIEQIFKNK